MSNDSECRWYQAGCKIGESVSDGVAAIAYDLLEKASGILEWLSTRWLHWSPGIDTESNAVAQVQGNLWWYTGGIAILGILLALGRMVLSNDFKSLIGVAKPIVNLIIVTGVYAAGIRLLDDAGNELAIWMFDQIESNHGDDATLGMAAIGALILMGPGAVSQAVGGALIMGLLSILCSAVLFGFMVFRDVVLLIMLAFIPTIAAATGTETGDQAFKKANGWLLALLLFKPVAAVIIALGVTLMQDNTDISGADEGSMMRPLSGVLIICLASLALPALIKFVVPAAAAGSSAFSGGAALAGAATVAGGAAIIAATAGTGGAAAGAGAGAGAAGGPPTGSGGESGGGPPTGSGGESGGGTGSGSSGGDSGSTSPGGASDETSASESAGASSDQADAAAGGASDGGSGDTASAGSDAGAEQAASGGDSTTGTPLASGSGESKSISGSDMAALTQAVGAGAENSSDGLDEAAEGA